MKVNLDLEKRTCKVYKESGDPRFTRGYAEPESTFLYHVKKALQAQGHDVIKKRMWKDGHMVDDQQQYIRTRVLNDHEGWAMFNMAWAISDLGEEFNKLRPGDYILLYVGIVA